MGALTAIGVYIIIWWLVLFTTLPLWVKPHQEADKHFGTAGSAPQRPYIGKKVALTTVIAFFVWLGVYILIETGIIEAWL